MNRRRKYKSDKIINKILANHFEEFRKVKWHRVRKEMREHIIDIVERTLNCGNMENGYIKHKCLECNEEYIHGFTCKSKFCSKCGRMYSLKWSDKQVNNMLNVTHRHAVFTMPEELRNYFYQEGELLKDLQDAVNSVVSNYYQNKVKGNHEVGLIAVVHTFGSDLKWNPHIHALFTEGGIDKDNKWFKKVSHTPYKYLRKSWQKLPLDIIKKNFTDIRTKRLINKLYKTHNEGFYVNAERDLTNIKQATKYIGRYLARPAIAEYRITNYDGKSVTFWYENKKPKKKITVTIDVLEFIGKEKKSFREEPGDFYYIITLKDGKEINFYQSSSEFEDTYLELEIFDKLIVDIAKVKKIASKENYKLCYLDKRYVDRFLRIIEN